jgi:LmbE family N-acetylglucosaminyl deacetylase
MNISKNKSKNKHYHALIIAPHPDDAEFGISGTVAKWTREGKEVAYVICTSGDKGTNDPTLKSAELAIIREKEQKAAARIAGVKEVVFLRYPDQEIEDTAEFRKEIVRLIRLYRPEVVATCDPYRQYLWHRDHRITGQVVLDAVYPYARDMLAYPDLFEQGYKPYKVKEVLLWGSPNINFYSDISDVFDIKIAALACHKSQFDILEMEKRMRERYSALAKDTGFKYAEAFHREEIWR